jgi:hypothetical protein
MKVQNGTELLNKLNDWATVSKEDLSAHVFYLKAEHTLEAISSFFQEYTQDEILQKDYHTIFIWSKHIRDFSLLLRDSLLALVKYEQFENDSVTLDIDFITKLVSIIKDAARDVLKYKEQNNLSDIEIKQFEHQINPVSYVIEQVEKLNIQIKKIYRSHDKVNEIRLNLESFKREFYLNFQKQTGAVESLIEQVEIVASMVASIHPLGNKESISEVIDGINTSYSNLESLQAIESMEVLSYPDKVNLIVPIDVDSGRLVTKALNIQSEISKWFSGNIYPHIIELENRRNTALETSLNSLNHARVKLSALILDEKESYDTSQSDVNTGITELRIEHIVPLKKEASEHRVKIEQYLDQDFHASSIYDEHNLFMPNNGSEQMTNISRDAQKRMISTYKNYKTSGYEWIKKSLAKYIELDRVPHNSYISNKLLINKNDERLSLFLKKGYLGKSFSVARPELIKPIINDYQLWKSGYASAILIFGQSGSGKSALIGMLSQSTMTDEMISVNAGEPYFTKNKSFERSYNLKNVVINIAHQYIGQKVILTIDDLGQWHNKDYNLFDNITILFELIQKFKGDVFFIVSCNTYLKERIGVFRDLDLFFSSQICVNNLANDDIKEALMMRFRALPELGLSDTEHAYAMSPILRNANGNIGHAMLEYCRFYNSKYKPDLKSQEFNELINDHKTVLKYIFCFQNIDVKDLSNILTETEYTDFINHVRYLIGLKILFYSRVNVISINPFLIYSVEKALESKKTT